MIVVRFKVTCQPSKTDDLVHAMRAVVAPSRALAGVVHFDIGRDLDDENSLIATEVFEDQAAMRRQEAQPQVARVLALIESGALAAPAEWTIYEVASDDAPAL